MNQSSHAQSHRGTVRTINEDAYLEMPQYGVWVVADGMGGHAAGDVASQLVIDTLQQAIGKTTPENISVELLKTAIENSNAKLQQMMEQEFSGNVVGSTVVVLLIKNDQYFCLWAGDSRAYLLRDNRLEQVTKDHSQVNDMVDQGLLSADEAETHPLANVITRAVGVDTSIDVEVISGNTLIGDVFLICSDGLNKEVSDREIEETLLSGNVIDSGMALLHACLVRNARDNVTCILVKNSEKNYQSIESSEDQTIPMNRF